MPLVHPIKAYLLAFVIATVCTAAAIPVVAKLAVRLGAVSKPGGRNVNAKTIPRLGGIAIAVGFLIPLVTIFPAESYVASILRTEWRKVVGLLAGALFLGAVGVLDDTRRLRASHKLIAQVAAATLAYTVGFRIDVVALPLGGTLNMGAFALPMTILWIVGIVNAVNLIDGLDGLAAGIAFFAGVTNLIVAYVTGEILVAAIMATMLGALLGFLFFNFNPARIFMGDSGSYFLGFVLGTMSLAGSAQKASTAISMMVPILALGVPIFDTLFTMVRRFLERRPLFSPDRGHIHHRLLDMGITHRRAVLILYGVSLALTTAAIAVSLGRSWTVGVAMLAASAVVVGLVRFLGYFQYVLVAQRQRARIRSEDTEKLRRALPDVVRALGDADDEAAVMAVLESLLVRADLGSVELVPVGERAHVLAWTRPLHVEPSELVSARYPLGDASRARYDLRVRWYCSNNDVSPQCEVLLQVIADVAAGTLGRVGARFAPEPANIERPATRVEAVSGTGESRRVESASS